MARVYRPAGYAFPPARGRDGMEFLADGRLVNYGIAAADGVRESAGHWTFEEPDKITIVCGGDERPTTVTFEVVSCDGERLTLRR